MSRSLPILVAAAVTAVLAAGWFAVGAYAQRDMAAPKMSTDPAELDSFEQRVREYLLEHPEVVMEALQLLQERQRVAEAESLERTIVERREEILNDPAAPVGGNPSGDVTVVEFFDYNCPYCRRVAPTMTALEEADPDLRLVYKEFPILGPGSQFAARAALASRRQGKYVAFHNALMRADDQVAEESVMRIAREVGLDPEQLEADMQDPAIQAAIDRTLQLADALQITGTPSFVIGQQIVPGAVDLRTLQSLVARARNEAKVRNTGTGDKG
ncbi:MAG: DsbA family protein [Geminicoccaceae bacterium]|nr:DsbA family protein [Geminicoccaceae bacterium]